MTKKKFFARAQPNGDGLLLGYETDSSRKVHHFPQPKQCHEPEPHGAGSYHNPEHHHDLIERVEAYLRNQS